MCLLFVCHRFVVIEEAASSDTKHRETNKLRVVKHNNKNTQQNEADRILDFGFQETVHNILAHLPRSRQTLLFSATLHTSVHRLGRAALKSPEIVSVHRDARSRAPAKLKQVHMVVNLEKKFDLLFSFLRSHSQKKIIVFVSACKQVRFLYEA